MPRPDMYLHATAESRRKGALAAAVPSAERRAGLAVVAQARERTLWLGLRRGRPTAKRRDGGTPAFGAAPIPPLRLVDIRRRDGSDNLLLRYEVVAVPAA